MPKSKYPNQIDTSVEIPAVRDNILEVGADTINSIRSALLNIERTLGINPQGATGNTVSDRLNKITDSNGNLLSSALTQAGQLTGPVVDSDVSEVAAIRESKLRLDFSTQVLQDEISTLNGQIDTLVAKINEISTSLTAHTYSGAVNRHKAAAISIASAIAGTSSAAASSLGEGDVQGALESLYDSHIYYDGTAISSANRSHTAEQVYLDTEDISGIISSSDVQGAIEELVSSSLNSQIDHQDSMHSNGRLRVGDVGSVSSDKGELILENIDISFVKANGIKSLTNILFDTPQAVVDVAESDILTITGDSDSINGDYEIAKVNLSSDTLYIESVDIFAVFNEDSSGSAQCSVHSNTKRGLNIASLLVTSREDPGLTSGQLLQVCNPEAVKVVTSGIKPSEITSSNRYFKISIDGMADVQLDAYNPAASRQTVDTIVSIINNQIADQHLSIAAYRVDLEDGGSELVIAGCIPDSGSETYTLTIKDGDDAGGTSLGFSDIIDEVISAKIGNEYFINGIPYSGLASKLDQTGLVYYANETVVSAGNSGVDFIEIGIIKGDLLHIVNASDDSDAGTYVIDNVTDTELTINSSQLSAGFSTTSDDDTIFKVYHDSYNMEGLTFEEVNDSFGAGLYDIVLDSDRSIRLDTRIEYAAEVLTTESLISIVDFEGDISNKEFTLEASVGTSCIEFTLDSGDVVEVSGTDSYFWIKSGAYNVSFKVFALSEPDIESKIISDGSDISMTIYGLTGLNEHTNLVLARMPYDSFRGRFGGGVGGPRILAQLPIGNISYDEISNIAKRYLSERPIDELRSNGIVRGCELSSVSIDGNGYYVVSVDAGVVYARGKRFEIGSIDSLTTDIDSSTVDKFYAYVDQFGNVLFDAATAGSCSASSSDGEQAFIASAEYNGSTVEIFDLRLFIDEVDLKILNSITVSPQKGMAHFVSLNKAIHYAKRFSEIFPNAGVPTVHLKSGTHKLYANHTVTLGSDIDTTAGYTSQYRDSVWINFPINIVGEGESSVLDLYNAYTDFPSPTSSDKGTDSDYVGSIDIGCAGLSTTPEQSTDLFDSGFITLKNFKIKNSKIQIIDSELEEAGTGYKLNFGVDIEGVIFDFSDVSSFAATNYGVFLKRVDLKASAERGNVSVRNCQFINSHITFDHNSSKYRNILISNNISRGSADSVTGGRDNYLIGVNGTGSIFDFDDAPSENNINIISNIIADNSETNDHANGPKIDDDGNHAWGDRVSRGLNVGHDLVVGGDSFSKSLNSMDAGSTLTLNGGSGIIVSGDITSDSSVQADGGFSGPAGGVKTSNYLKPGTVDLTGGSDTISRPAGLSTYTIWGINVLIENTSNVWVPPHRGDDTAPGQNYYSIGINDSDGEISISNAGSNFNNASINYRVIYIYS